MMVMETTRAGTGTRERPASAKARLKRWACLLAGLGAIVFFMFVAAPLMQRVEPVKTIHTFIRERDIDATPLFYTEAEEFSQAERHMRDAARFCPRKP